MTHLNITLVALSYITNYNLEKDSTSKDKYHIGAKKCTDRWLYISILKLNKRGSQALLFVFYQALHVVKV